MKSLILLCSLLVALALPATAKAYFQAEAEMVAKAEVIVVIDLQEPVPNVDSSDPFSDPKGSGYYRLKAEAKVVTILKGKLPEKFTLFGGESFICAQCTPTKGRFLAFLRKDGGRWVGSNWHFSLRQVEDGKIEWYSNETDRNLVFMEETKVLARVRELMTRPSKPE